jgi:hypothetical protein
MNQIYVEEVASTCLSAGHISETAEHILVKYGVGGLCLKFWGEF